MPPQPYPNYYGDDQAHNQVQLKDKLLEPESEVVAKEINRNIQLGNIERSEKPLVVSQYRMAKIFLEIPPTEGGIYINWVGDIILHSINFDLAVSNSVNALGRLSANTNINKTTFKDESPKSSFASLSNPGRNG
jgi:hypothetical protein